MPDCLSRWSQRLLAQAARALPCACALCGGESRQAVCAGCERQVFGNSPPRCLRCAIPLPDGAPVCGTCLKAPPAFDASLAVTDYAPPADQLVLALKFGGRLELASMIASKLHDAARSLQAASLPTLLTAVPLGQERLVERGFNQALEIARPLARMLGAGFDGRLLVRRRETRAQSMLHPDERRRNMRGVFMVASEMIGRLHGVHVGVVDDVMTTGATLNEVARTLKRCGAARVTNFVFARTAQQ